MNSCELPLFEDFENAIKNKKWPIAFTGGPSQKGTLDVLDMLSNYLALSPQQVPVGYGDDPVRYTLKNGDHFSDVFFKYRSTDVVSRNYKRDMTQAEIDRMRNDPNQILRRNYGTVIHNVMQQLIESIHSGTKIDYQKLSDSAGTQTPLTVEMVQQLEAGARRVYKEILDVQKRIDPNGKMEIRTENPLADPVKDVAGTADLIAVYSDGSVGIVDFKTFSPVENIKVDPISKERYLANDKFISVQKKDGWRLQLSQYKRMMLKYLPVKDVMFTRVVPIWLDFDYNTTDKKLLGLRKISTEQDNYLRTRSIGAEKVGIKYIDDFLTTRYKEIKRLVSELKEAPKEERPKLIERIETIETAIELFVNTMQLTQFQSEALLVSEKIAKDLSNVPFNELKHTVHYLESVLDLQDEFVRQHHDNVNIQLSEEVKLQIAKNYAHINEEFRNRVLDMVSDGYGKIDVTGGKIILSEDDFLTQFFSATTDFQNPFIRKAQDMFQDSYNKQRRELEKFDKEMFEVEKNVLENFLRGRGETLADLHKYLINKKTGRYYSKVSSTFYEEKKEARENKDVDFMVNAYKVRDKNLNGETYQRWYARSKKEYEATLKERYPNQGERVDKAMKWWESQWDLSLNKVTGKPNHPSAWLKASNSWLELKPETLQRYKSEQYSVIESNPSLSAYYDKMMEFNSRFQQLVGFDAVNSQLFYPIVRADIVEKAQRSDLYSALGDIKKTFSIREDETMFGQQNIDVEGEVKVPIFFTNPFRDADGKITTAELSMDIGASTRLFAKMALNYKYMSEIESQILAIKDMLKTVEYEKKGWGTKTFETLDNLALKDKTVGGSMTDRVFNALTNYHLYGIQMDSSIGGEKFNYIISKLQNFFSIRTLGLGIIPATASYVSAQLNTRLEATKGQIFNINQWNDSLKLQATDSKRYHGIGYYFGIHGEDMLRDVVTNRAGGNILKDNLYSSTAQQYINQRLLMRPYSYGDERIDNHIANAMAMNYGIDSNGNVRRLANLPEGSKPLRDMITINENGELSFEGISDNDVILRITRQFQQKVRAGQRRIKGTMSSEEIAFWQTTIYGRLMMQFKSWMPGVVRERFGSLKYNNVLDTAEQGRYRVFWDEVSSEQDIKTGMFWLETLGNSLKFVTKDLLTYGTIGRMLGNEYKFDDKKARAQYAAFQRKYANSPVMEGMFPTYEQFLEMKKGQIKAMLGEIEILLVLTAMIFLLGSDYDDDGEKLYAEMWLTHKMFQVLNRTKTEMSFTYDPMEYEKLFANPIPLIGLFTQARKLVGNTLDETGDVFFGEGDARFPIPFGANKGDEKAGKFHYTVSLIPGIYYIRKTFDVLESDKSATR
jgi:hypothetical protein